MLLFTVLREGNLLFINDAIFSVLLQQHRSLDGVHVIVQLLRVGVGGVFDSFACSWDFFFSYYTALPNCYEGLCLILLQYHVQLISTEKLLFSEGKQRGSRYGEQGRWAGKGGGRGNCAWDRMYERRINKKIQ